jgi:hypothetical protein
MFQDVFFVEKHVLLDSFIVFPSMVDHLFIDVVCDVHDLVFYLGLII